MVTKKEKIEEEIKVVKEVMAIQEKKQEAGWNDIVELEEDITIPNQYRYLTDYSDELLEEHLQRLERDRQMMKNDDLFTDID